MSINFEIEQDDRATEIMRRLRGADDFDEEWGGLSQEDRDLLVKAVLSRYRLLPPGSPSSRRESLESRIA